MEIVYLKGDYDLICARIAARTGHYMKPELLRSQFEDLEEPVDALTVDAGLTVDQIVERVIRQMRLSDPADARACDRDVPRATAGE